MSAPPRTRSRRLPAGRWLLFLLLAAAVVWVVSLLRGESDRLDLEDPSIGPEFGRTTSVTFAEGGDSIVVVREGEVYWVVHPVRDRASPLFMAELRRQAEGLRVNRVLPAEDAGLFGLDRPEKRIAIEDERGRWWRLSIGDTVPVGSQIYVRPEGPEAPVLLVDLFPVRRFFTPDLIGVRDRVPAPLRPGPPDSLVVVAGDRRLHAFRRAEAWEARVPAGLRLDTVTLNEIVQSLRAPTIEAFLDDRAPSALGLDPPRALWILHQGSRAETVRVGHAGPDGTVYILPSARSYPALHTSGLFRMLVGGWPEVADRRLVSAHADSIQSIEFGGSGALRRSRGGWVREPAGTPISRPRALGDDVINLTGAVVRRYPVAETPPAPGRERLTLRIVTASAAETLILAQAGDSVLARSTRLPRWGTIDARFWRIWREWRDPPGEKGGEKNRVSNGTVR